jgi:hypothetical protein
LLSPNENEDDCNCRHSRAQLGKQLAMAGIKGDLSILRHANVADQNPFRKSVAGIVLQNLGDAAERIHKTSHARIRSSNHRPPIFDTPKDRVGEMLARTGRLQKPTVVCYID